MSGWRLLRVLCMCTALAWAPLAPAADASFGALLQQADGLRSADAQKFADVLAQLDARVAEATPVQRQQLRYLHSYQLALGGDFKGAIRDLRELFEEVADPSLKFRVGAFLANNFAATREFAEGLGYLDRTLALLPQVPDQELRLQGLVGASVMYNQVGQHDLALHYAEEILAGSPGGRTRCMADFMRLEALFNLDDRAQQDNEFSERIEHCEAQGEALVAGFIRGYQARNLARQGRHAEAADLLLAHLAEVESTRYPRLIGEIQSLLAEYRLAQGDAAQAQVHARRAIENSSGIAYSLPLVMAHKVLYECALTRGDIRDALTHYRSYAEADRAYLDAIKARELAVQLVRHETLQKTQTIELLNKQNRVLQLEQQVARQAATNSQLLLALALILLASLATWAWRARRTHRHMKRLAEIDGLTGISNRRHFTQRAETLLAAAARTRSSACLILWDLDWFKSINDHYGHATGDWVLRQVVAVCSPLLRAQDCFGRIGGEEFAVLMADADLVAGCALAERLRAAIAGIDARHGGARFQVSASFGIASCGESGHELDRLMGLADEAAYRSKLGGRNRCTATIGAATAAPIVG